MFQNIICTHSPSCLPPPNIAPDGDTPLLASTRRGHEETVEALVIYGADINIPGADSYTPMHCAAQKGLIKIVDIFLNANVNLTAKYNSCFTLPC